MLKILMFVNVDWFFVSHRLPIAKEGQAQGTDFFVYADISDRCPYFEPEGYTFRRSPIKRKMRLLFLPAEIFRLYFLVRFEKPDVVHAVTIKPILILGALCKFLGIPFVASISGLGPVFSDSSLLGRIRRRIAVAAYCHVFSNPRSIVVCQSQHDKSVMTHTVGVREEAVVMTNGSGVNLSEIRHTDRTKRASHTPIVFMASRLLSDKGICEFIQMASTLRQRDVCARFVLAGATDELSPTNLAERDVTEMCEAAGVEFLGEVNEIGLRLAEADVFVYPSYYAEGLPKILLEAAAAGLPVVTTDHPGCRDAIIHDVTGLIVPTRDVSALANAVTVLLEDFRKRVAFGEAARMNAEANFDEKIVVQRHFDTYRNISELF